MDLGFSLVEQTKIVTAASERARNTVIYGGGGEMRIERVYEGPKRTGLRLTFEDHGPGIADVELALRDGFTTGNGLGLGLNGARKLSHEFAIRSNPGAGTRVTITRWK
jgi:serine/threonine-protein kinase RsbT